MDVKKEDKSEQSKKDHIVYYKSLNKIISELQEEIKKFIHVEKEFVHSTNNLTLEFYIDKELAWFDGISIIHVNKFCENLYDLAQINHSEILFNAIF